MAAIAVARWRSRWHSDKRCESDAMTHPVLRQWRGHDRSGRFLIAMLQFLVLLLPLDLLNGP
jgi:hypothetical protein